MVLTMDKFGRVLIPKAIRTVLGLYPGKEVEVEICAATSSIEIRPKKPEITLEYDESGFPILVGGDPYPDDFDTVAFLKESYEEYHKDRFGV